MKVDLFKNLSLSRPNNTYEGGNKNTIEIINGSDWVKVQDEVNAHKAHFVSIRDGLQHIRLVLHVHETQSAAGKNACNVYTSKSSRSVNCAPVQSTEYKTLVDFMIYNYGELDDNGVDPGELSKVGCGTAGYIKISRRTIKGTLRSKVNSLTQKAVGTKDSLARQYATHALFLGSLSMISERARGSSAPLVLLIVLGVMKNNTLTAPYAKSTVDTVTNYIIEASIAGKQKGAEAIHDFSERYEAFKKRLGEEQQFLATEAGKKINKRQRDIRFKEISDLDKAFEKGFPDFYHAVNLYLSAKTKKKKNKPAAISNKEIPVMIRLAMYEHYLRSVRGYDHL